MGQCRRRSFRLRQSIGNCLVSILRQRIALQHLPPEAKRLLAIAPVVTNGRRGPEPGQTRGKFTRLCEQLFRFLQLSPARVRISRILQEVTILWTQLQRALQELKGARRLLQLTERAEEGEGRLRRQGGETLEAILEPGQRSVGLFGMTR